MEDFDIIRLIKLGDTEAYSLLVEKYHRNLLNFILRLIGDRDIVEDIGQEVFLNVYKTLKDFDVTRGTPFSAWLFMSARNRCISEIRSRKGKDKISIEDMDIRSMAPGPEEVLMSSEATKAVKTSLEQLPEPYKSTIYNSIRGASVDEIATRERISPGTVKSRLFRARKKMKLLLSEYYGG